MRLWTLASTLPLLVVCVALVGCRGHEADDRRTGTITAADIARARATWPAGVAAQVDSGNAAYSAQDYDRAARHYHRAAELGPDISAAWFGIYITEHARGNVAAADSAMERTRAIAAGASLLHAPGADTGRIP
jgi:tetratricopeptide (TPR) repeat protein